VFVARGRVLKTKTFVRWARKERIDDALLAAAVAEMRRGLIDANLGGSLLKKRIARAGGGKSGGYRTSVASNQRNRWVFMYGFAKKERDNLDDDELSDLKRIGQAYLAMSEEAILRAVGQGELQEIDYGETQAS
jgi:hypothetical protein